MNQSISEEWEKLFDGHCICDKYAPQEDIGCIIHGEDGIKAKKFLQSKISQAYQEGVKKGEEYQRMSNLIHKKSILERIKNLSDYSQQEEWRDCKKQLEMLNLSDPKNKEIFEEAQKKGL